MSKTVKKAKTFQNTVIPRDWEVARILDFGKVLTGNTPPTIVEDNYGDEYMFVGPIDLGTQKYILKTEKKLSAKGFSISRKFPKGAVLFTCIGSTIGKSGIATEELTSNQQINAIITNDKNYNEFLYYQLEKNAERIRLLAGEQAVPIINKSQFESTFLLRAPLPEQKAIAKVLSTWDHAIQKTEALLAQKELRKKWLMQQLLTGKKRLKGFDGEWRELHIRDIAKEVSIKNKDNKQLTVLSCTKYDGLVPSLEYFGRKVFADDLRTYKIVPKNHFAYATNHIEEGSIGYQEIYQESLISPMYTVFKTDKTINDIFFYKLLKSHPLMYQYQNRMEGSIDRRGGLRWDAFSIIRIHLPSVEEQTAIAQVLQAADKEIELIKAKATQLREQKKGLMQVLLTGKKRLNQDFQD